MVDLPYPGKENSEACNQATEVISSRLFHHRTCQVALIMMGIKKVKILKQQIRKATNSKYIKVNNRRVVIKKTYPFKMRRVKSIVRVHNLLKARK